MPKGIKTKVAGVSREIVGMRTRVAGVARTITKTFVKVNGVKKQVYPYVPFPAGIILIRTVSGVPAGWTEFTAANGKNVVGSGASHSLLTSGGSSTVTKTLTTTISPSHSGSTTFDSAGYAGTTNLKGTATEAGHSHSATFSQTGVLPEYREVHLAKLTADSSVLPADMATFADRAIAGASQIVTGAGRVVAGGTYGVHGGAAFSSLGISTDAVPSHTHSVSLKNSGAPLGFNAVYNVVSAGGHSHTVTVTATLNPKTLNLGIFSSGGLGPVKGMIGLWESTIPPEGWATCDGSLGTPDMRDRLASVAASGSFKALAGDNLVRFTGTTNSAGAHSHKGSLLTTFGTAPAPSSHEDSVGDHTHDVDESAAYEAPWYALNFIQKL